VTEDYVASAVHRASRRLIPFLVLCYAVNFLDRVNVGFAALAMNADARHHAGVFGFGAGIFFVGYIPFEIPSNLALARFGARIWIARIMISWGLVATAMGFVAGAASFYALRFLLGEAGFFPGIILCLTYWFPREERGRDRGLRPRTSFPRRGAWIWPGRSPCNSGRWRGKVAEEAV
jgi:ACS family tartrate transporter-like MFS transporter